MISFPKIKKYIVCIVEDAYGVVTVMYIDYSNQRRGNKKSEIKSSNNPLVHCLSKIMKSPTGKLVSGTNAFVFLRFRVKKTSIKWIERLSVAPDFGENFGELWSGDPSTYSKWRHFPLRLR